MKTALVTGVTSGIGHALTHALISRGLTVIGVGRREERLLLLQKELGKTFIPLHADVSTEHGRHKIETKLESLTNLDFLVHNAAIVEPMAYLKDCQLEDVRKLFSVNVEGPLFLTQVLLPQLKSSRVLHVSSGAAQVALPGINPYCMTKAALDRLSAGWTSEVSDTCFSVMTPGGANTEMMDQLQSDAHPLPEHAREISDKLTSPELVAKFIAWLLLDISSDEFVSKSWDIYDESHQDRWAKGIDIINPFV